MNSIPAVTFESAIDTQPATPELSLDDMSLSGLGPLQKLTRILLVKPYAPTPIKAESPPLGLLCLAASLREAFAETVEIKVLDMKLYRQALPNIVEVLEEFAPDIVGLSALSAEADASITMIETIKAHNPNTVTVLGGPYTHLRAGEILGKSRVDWVIDGPGDRNFPLAVSRYINGMELGDDIPGFNYRKADGSCHTITKQDFVNDLDSLPLPDWRYIDFDLYARRPNLSSTLKGKRYAMLFTSRGCPYLCNYCHDIFTKRFKFQSAERVIAEIEYLYDHFGVTEFQIIDDIFNLHKPRLKQVMHEVDRRWPGKMHFNFPNGIRADIIDDDVLDDLKLGGTYSINVAIETATPRLQTLMEKHLDIEKTRWVIDAADERGMLVYGHFMLGFPTETEEELKATADFALNSRLTQAHIFTVMPQPNTPLYDLCEQENKQATIDVTVADEGGKMTLQGVESDVSWYERAYGFPLKEFQYKLTMKFYLSPSRIWRYLRRTPLKNLPVKIGRFFYFSLGHLLFKLFPALKKF